MKAISPLQCSSSAVATPKIFTEINEPEPAINMNFPIE